jgi:hypothetical protein
MPDGTSSGGGDTCELDNERFVLPLAADDVLIAPKLHRWIEMITSPFGRNSEELNRKLKGRGTNESSTTRL